MQVADIHVAQLRRGGAGGHTRTQKTQRGGWVQGLANGMRKALGKDFANGFPGVLAQGSWQGLKL